MHGHDWNDLVDISLGNLPNFTGNKAWLGRLGREITGDHEIIATVAQSAFHHPNFGLLSVPPKSIHHISTYSHEIPRMLFPRESKESPYRFFSELAMDNSYDLNVIGLV
jgi:hypothetical protein